MATYFRVVDNVHAWVTQPRDPEDSWDRDNTRQEHSLVGLELVDSNGFWDVVLEGEYEPNRPYYLVYAIYDTGDSFGRDEGRIEYIGLYSDLEVAHENERRCRECVEGYSVTLVTDSGKEYKVSTPWVGYFEHLQYVDTETLFPR